MDGDEKEGKVRGEGRWRRAISIRENGSDEVYGVSRQRGRSRENARIMNTGVADLPAARGHRLQ